LGEKGEDNSLPPGKELSVRFSIVRPLKVESSGAVFLFRSGVMEQQTDFREFFKYTALSVMGTLGVSCYILADTFFVSEGLGTNGLAALNLAIPVYNFIHGTGLMLGMGGATRFCVCKSRQRREDVDKIYMNTIYLAALFSAVFVLIGLFFGEKLSLCLGADKNVWEMTTTYLRWLLLFSPAFILNDILLCFVRNDDSPRLSMTAMIIGSFSNIILDYIFIFPMKMGIFGAIFATGLSPVISIIIMLLHWIKRKNTFHVCRTKMKADIVLQELALGFPSLIAQVSSGIVMITFNGIILKLEGNTGVAAYGVIANISLVVVAIYTGIAQGVQPLISRFYGKGNDRQVRTMLRYSLQVMFMISLFIYLIVFVFAQPIASVFNSEDNLELQRIAVTGLKIYFTSSAFVGYNIILANFFTSVEKALPAHILSMIRGLILIIPMAFLLSAIGGMIGIWLTYPITEVLAAVLGYVIYKYCLNK